jgi:hypothetical protein
MLQRALTSQRLVALFALGWLLFNYPLLAVFSSDRSMFGIPLLYGYLFTVWALFICLMAFIAQAPRKSHAPPNQDQG